MPSRSSGGHAIVGGGSAALGAGTLIAALARPPLLEGGFLGTPLWALALTSGSVLTLSGALVLLFTFRRPEETSVEVPAHVAFNSRMSVPSIVPPLPTPAARPAGASVPAGARLPAPAQPSQQRVAPLKADTAAIDGEIRELTRRINKAGVMLATGQLSQQGYLAYVEDLKSQRGKLEAQKVRYELRS